MYGPGGVGLKPLGRSEAALGNTVDLLQLAQCSAEEQQGFEGMWLTEMSEVGSVAGQVAVETGICRASVGFEEGQLQCALNQGAAM
jgi:hypothetical protein